MPFLKCTLSRFVLSILSRDKSETFSPPWDRTPSTVTKPQSEENEQGDITGVVLVSRQMLHEKRSN